MSSNKATSVLLSRRTESVSKRDGPLSEQRKRTFTVLSTNMLCQGKRPLARPRSGWADIKINVTELDLDSTSWCYSVFGLGFPNPHEGRAPWMISQFWTQHRTRLCCKRNWSPASSVSSAWDTALLYRLTVYLINCETRPGSRQAINRESCNLIRTVALPPDTQTSRLHCFTLHI